MFVERTNEHANGPRNPVLIESTIIKRYRSEYHLVSSNGTSDPALTLGQQRSNKSWISDFTPVSRVYRVFETLARKYSQPVSVPVPSPHLSPSRQGLQVASRELHYEAERGNLPEALPILATSVVLSLRGFMVEAWAR